MVLKASLKVWWYAGAFGIRAGANISTDVSPYLGRHMCIHAILIPGVIAGSPLLTIIEYSICKGLVTYYLCVYV